MNDVLKKWGLMAGLKRVELKGGIEEVEKGWSL